MLTNRWRSFQISCDIDTGLSDLHKVTVTELRCLLLILKTSGKTSADEWEERAVEWRRVKMNERPVQMSKDKSKANERQV